MTNDVQQLNGVESGALAAAFLNHKGRMVADVIVHKAAEDVFFLDLHRELIPKILKYLKLTKLRSNVSVTDARKEYDVWSIAAPEGVSIDDLEPELQLPAATLIKDPRFDGLGYRMYHGHKDGENYVVEKLKGLGLSFAQLETYQSFRMLNGIPEGLELDGVIPLEYNLEQLNGVSFTKGCYTGQELTARTHFQGLVRKRLVPVIIGDGGVASSYSQEESDQQQLKSALLGIECNPLGSPLETPIPLDAQGSAKSPGKIIAVAPQSNIGLAHLRLSEGYETEWLKPSAFQTKESGIPVRVPKFPAWWDSAAATSGAEV